VLARITAFNHTGLCTTHSVRHAYQRASRARSNATRNFLHRFANRMRMMDTMRRLNYVMPNL
jgi:hypothetical protein